MLHSTHDHYFKNTLRDARIAREFFETYLPEQIQQQIQLDSLQLQQESFCDEHLKALHTDILYTVYFDGTTGYLYLLCEHQSTPSRLMAFRLLKYMVRIMDHHVEKLGHAELPLIYPLVYYTGQAEYKQPRDLFELFGDQQEQAKQMLFQPFQLIELNHIADHILFQRQWLNVMELVMKHIRDADILCVKEVQLAIQETDHRGSRDYIIATLTYMMSKGGIEEPQEFMDKIQNLLTDETRSEMMTVAQWLEQKGFNEGMQQGMQQGFLQGEHALFMRLLTRKFGEKAVVYQQRIEQADEKMLVLWSERLIDARDIHEIFQKS